MKWYGKEHLDPKKTKALVSLWQAPPGNSAAHYYDLFPQLYPKYLPDNHYIVKYDESLYAKDRDYSTFKPAPAEIKSSHRVEWEDGYGPCHACPICIRAKELNEERQADYYKRLKAWRENGTPM
jgi:hypothetical protein